MPRPKNWQTTIHWCRHTSYRQWFPSSYLHHPSGQSGFASPWSYRQSAGMRQRVCQHGTCEICFDSHFQLNIQNYNVLSVSNRLRPFSDCWLHIVDDRPRVRSPRHFPLWNLVFPREISLLHPIWDCTRNARSFVSISIHGVKVIPCTKCMWQFTPVQKRQKHAGHEVLATFPGWSSSMSRRRSEKPTPKNSWMLALIACLSVLHYGFWKRVWVRWAEICRYS